MKSAKYFPIGISTLEKIQLGDFYYVDKTEFVETLARQGQYYFLSRPRRFGKSLLLDTIKQAFLGKREIFKGLYLEHHWDWEQKYPVIHISFASNEQQSAHYRLEDKIVTLLTANAENYGLTLRGKSCADQFSFLIQDLHTKYKKNVVILIDEYDKPILDMITDLPTAEAIRNQLRSFYSVIKEHDDKVRFAFLTGVSKFAKAGVFSGLNNLNDITYDEKYGAICGYTQKELENTFAADLLPEDLPKIKQWYNGYYFLGKEGVYNPFSILNFFEKGKRYSNYWFASGTPTFLVQLIKQRQFYIPDLEQVEMAEDELQSFEIERLPLVPLLLQTGYLTIQSEKFYGDQISYVLSYPNLEVRQSLNSRLAEMSVTTEVKSKIHFALRKALSHHQLDKMKEIFTSLFASIPHDWYRNNPIAQYEGFYCATVYSYLMGLGYQAIAEDVTSQGKIDITIVLEDAVVIMEFKLTTHGGAHSALQQIKEKRYVDKYASHHKSIYLLGMSFNPETRNVEECMVEKVS